MYYVGQQVVCIDDRFLMDRLIKIIECGIKTPVEGNIYTIRRIDTRPYGTGFLLEEIINAKLHFGEEYCEPLFYADRFRPMVESDLRQIERHLPAAVGKAFTPAQECQLVD